MEESKYIKTQKSIIANRKRSTQNIPLPLSLTLNNMQNKYDYPILEYQEKFKSNYSDMKGSLAGIGGNITNYKHEIAKMENFLLTINEHERNHKGILKKYTTLRKILEESQEIESLIGKLSSNQQIINISEYVNLHSKVKEIIQFFRESQLTDRKDFESNMVKLMRRGFKVYEETFYLILKRYNAMEMTQNTENEKMNLLNKIRSLAECLQDEEISYNFTHKLIQDRSNMIVQKLEDLKISVSKNVNEDNYEKNCGFITKFLLESEKMFAVEKDYIYKILHSCNVELKETVYSGIIEAPLEKILGSLKDLAIKHTKTNVRRIDFYQNFDILDVWHERTYKAYKTIVEYFNKDILNNICHKITLIENFCIKYIDEFIKEISSLNEKIESENVLKTCNDAIFFLSHVLTFETAYEFVKNELATNKIDFSVEILIQTLIKRLEIKSSILDKKYGPLKFIFLINNIFFLQSKIYQKPFCNYVNKAFADALTDKLNTYIEIYLESSWSKVVEVTFDQKDNNLINFEGDGKNLKMASKELLKKKFAAFNETMKMNLKFQQHLQIIDTGLEKKLIKANIDHIANRYAEFYEKFSATGFTKFKNKYILYNSGADVIQDLQLYFMPDSYRK